MQPVQQLVQEDKPSWWHSWLVPSNLPKFLLVLGIFLFLLLFVLPIKPACTGTSELYTDSAGKQLTRCTGINSDGKLIEMTAWTTIMPQSDYWKFLVAWGTMIVILVVIDWWKNKNKKVRGYVPPNLLEEEILLQKEFAKYNQTITEVISSGCGEKYGIKSVEPHTMYFKVRIWNAIKRIEEVSLVAVNVLNRKVYGIERGHIHIENGVFDWTGARKEERFPDNNLSFIRPKQLTIEMEKPSIAEEEEKKEAEEEKKGV